MPYNTQEQRKKVNDLLDQVFRNTDTKGDINYCITRLVHLWVIKQLQMFWQGKKKYTVLDEGMGIFNSAAKCFFRSILGLYEDEAMLKNGPVSELDENYYQLLKLKYEKEEKEN